MDLICLCVSCCTLTARRAERHCRSILRIDNVLQIATHKFESHGRLEGNSNLEFDVVDEATSPFILKMPKGLVASSTTKNREPTVFTDVGQECPTYNSPAAHPRSCSRKIFELWRMSTGSERCNKKCSI